MLRIIHVIDDLLSVGGFETYSVYASDVVPFMRQSGEALLQGGQARAELAGVKAETLLLEGISPRLCQVVEEQVKSWGADLVVIGTHGRRGVGRLMLGSDAEQVVRTASVPVLLVRGPVIADATTVPETHRPPPRPSRRHGLKPRPALHRRLACRTPRRRSFAKNTRPLSAMLRSILMLLAQHRKGRSLPDFGALRAMLFYLDEFPEQRHHRKNRSCCSEAAGPHAGSRGILDRLEEEHARGEHCIRGLEHSLLAFEMMGEARRAAFEQAAERYVAFYLAHMRLEEEHILPLAERVLTAADWAELDEAFSTNRDPLTGHQPDDDYRALFSRIVKLGAGAHRPGCRAGASHSEWLTRWKSGSSADRFAWKPRFFTSLSMSALWFSTRPSMRVRPRSRATSMMLSINREPSPLPLKSSATTSENSQLALSDWSHNARRRRCALAHSHGPCPAIYAPPPAPSRGRSRSA